MSGGNAATYNDSAAPDPWGYTERAFERKVSIMANANVVELTQDNWEQEVVNSDKPVLVDFWAPWCGPCRALGPTIDKIADQFAGKVKVGKVNVDDAQDIAVRYGISSIPQLFVFHGGDQPTERPSPGAHSEANIVKMLNRVLGA
jgi:thioredoxin 1